MTPGTQSGVDVNTSDNPNAINTVNSYRRRVHVFLQQVSDIDSSGNETPDTSNAQDFELPPTTGLNGGLPGAISNIYNYYWGNTTTAYAPVTSDDLPIPITANFSKSKYRVTVVGAGATTSTYSSLTDAQATAQAQVAIGGFVQDALIPLFANFYFGSGFETYGQTPTAFEANWRKDLTSDLLAQISNLPGLQQKIQTGDYAGAMLDVIDSLRTSGTFRDVFTDSLEQAAGKQFASQVGSDALQSFSTILNAAGGALQIFDSSVYIAQLSRSDADDEWTVINGGQKVTLTPAQNTIEQFGQGTLNLTAALPGLDNSTGYSYRFTNTAGTGDIAPADGSGPASTSFCSSYPIVTYSTRFSPLLTHNVTDTVTVSAYYGGNCGQTNLLGKAATANVTVTPSGVNVSSSSAGITQNATQSFHGFISGTGLTDVFSFEYTLSGLGADGIAGTLTDVGGSGQTGTSVCLPGSSSNVTFAPNASPTITGIVTNELTVSAYNGTGCSTSQLIGSAVAIVTIAPQGILLQPRKSSTPQTDAVIFSATLGSAQQGTTYSYLWSAGIQYGALHEANGGGASGSFCSKYDEAIYKPNAAPPLPKPVRDAISVQTFAGSTCDTSAAVSATATTPITITPAAKNISIPLDNAVQSLLQASDGNYYASSAFNTIAAQLTENYSKYVTNAYCTSNTSFGTSNPCGEIYRITPSGTQTAIHVFGADPGNVNAAQAGTGPVQMLEGPDGALYGITNEGYYFRQTLDGTFTILNVISDAGGQLLLGSDGFFYYKGLYTVYRLGLDGSLNRFYRFPNPNLPDGSFTTIQSLMEASDGNFYGFAGNYSGTVSDDQPDGSQIFFRLTRGGQMDVLNSFNPFLNFQLTGPNLMEGSDGAFYTTGYTVGSGGLQLLRITPRGEVGPVYTQASTFPTYVGTLVPPRTLQGGSLFIGSDANIYGTSDVTNLASGYVSDPTCVTTTGGVNNINESASCNAVAQLTVTGDYAEIYTFPGGDYGIEPEDYQYFGGFSQNRESGGGIPIQNSNGYIVGTTLAEPTLNFPNLGGTIYQLDANLPPPVQLSVLQAGTSNVLETAAVNQQVELWWTVLAAYSLTAQQCYAFIQTQPDGTPSTGAGTWAGKQYGTQTGSGYTGSLLVTPTAAGTYTYALTCGGRESGFATLTVQ